MKKLTFTEAERDDYQSILERQLSNTDNIMYYSHELNDMPEELEGQQEGYYDCSHGYYEFLGTHDELWNATRLELHDVIYEFTD